MLSQSEHPTTRILHRILGLMPGPGHYNTEEEARKMVWQMDRIIEEETEQQKGLYNED